MFFELDSCIEKNQNKTHFEEGTSESPPLELFRKANFKAMYKGPKSAI